MHLCLLGGSEYMNVVSYRHEVVARTQAHGAGGPLKARFGFTEPDIYEAGPVPSHRRVGIECQRSIDQGGTAASMHNTMAHGHFFASRYNETCYWAGKALSDVPELHPALRILAASSAFAGDFERAHNAIERLRCVDPHLRVSNLRNVLGPYHRPDFIAKYEEGLRKAGLQE
jgi:hypothetical protein